MTVKEFYDTLDKNTRLSTNNIYLFDSQGICEDATDLKFNLKEEYADEKVNKIEIISDYCNFDIYLTIDA